MYTNCKSLESKTMVLSDGIHYSYKNLQHLFKTFKCNETVSFMKHRVTRNLTHHSNKSTSIPSCNLSISHQWFIYQQ